MILTFYVLYGTFVECVIPVRKMDSFAREGQR